jgi:hypothetical protein
VLKAAGLVLDRRDAQRVRYRLTRILRPPITPSLPPSCCLRSRGQERGMTAEAQGIEPREAPHWP